MYAPFINLLLKLSFILQWTMMLVVFL